MLKTTLQERLSQPVLGIDEDIPDLIFKELLKRLRLEI